MDATASKDTIDYIHQMTPALKHSSTMKNVSSQQQKDTSQNTAVSEI